MTLVGVATVADVPAGRRVATAKLAAIVVLAVPVLLSTDVLTSAVLVVGELLVLPLLGLRVSWLWRAWPVLVSLAGIWIGNVVAGADAAALVPVTLRVLALALPGLLFVRTTDPTDLADALVQRWHAPARFAYGALAAFRLLPLLAGEFVSMRRARRARGLGAGWNPLAWVRTGVALLFGLLVQAVRRAVRLAAAMDARGFDAGGPRTSARIVVVTAADRWLVAGAVALAALAVVVSVVSGGWAPVFS